MTFAHVLKRYDTRAEPLPAPTDGDWARLEQSLGVSLPADFKVFCEHVRSYYFEGELPAIYGTVSDGTEWEVLLARERKHGLPQFLVPFCSVGNGDLHCFRFAAGLASPPDIVYWYHDGSVGQANAPERLAASFAEWLDGYVTDAF